MTDIRGERKIELEDEYGVTIHETTDPTSDWYGRTWEIRREGELLAGISWSGTSRTYSTNGMGGFLTFEGAMDQRFGAVAVIE